MKQIYGSLPRTNFDPFVGRQQPTNPKFRDFFHRTKFQTHGFLTIVMFYLFYLDPTENV